MLNYLFHSDIYELYTKHYENNLDQIGKLLKKIKIIHIVHSFEVGGIENLILNLCNMMNKEKYEFHLLTLTNDKLRMLQELPKEIFVHSLPVTHKKIKTLRGLVRAFFQLVKIIRTIHSDIIHTHLTSLPLLFISTAIKYANVTSIHIRTLHTAGLFYENQNELSNKLKLFAEKLAMKLLKTRLISVSNIVHKNNLFHFEKIAKDIVMIPNGIDLNKFDQTLYPNVSKEIFGCSKGKLLVSYVARLDEGKNHNFLIDIWSDVLTLFPHIILCFAGDGIYKEILQEKAKKMNLEKHIIFLGSINNVPELLSASDFALFPSSYEGFGLVMIEKFAMKLPVVASDINSFQTIATNNENAFLVSLENKPEFIEQIVNLCMYPILRKKMGENAYSTSRQYSIDNTSHLYDQYYTHCLYNQQK